MSKFRKSAVGLAVATMLAITFAPFRTANALVEWALAEDAVALNITGVSPHVERTSSAGRASQFEH
jgi:hypothetical protein